MTDREVMQMALDFLTSKRWGRVPYMDCEVFSDAHELAEALRAALAGPVQEPVAWVHPTQGHMQRRTETMPPEVVASYERGGWTPLYTAPPTRSPLTEPE